jgi:hypothetical protein
MKIIVTPELITNEVIETVRNEKCNLLSALETVLDNHEIEMEDCAPFITPALQAKLEAEAQELHLLKEKNRTKKLF